MDVSSLKKFDTTQSDRSDLGMSNASSVGLGLSNVSDVDLPGMGTLRQGIALRGPA